MSHSTCARSWFAFRRMVFSFVAILGLVGQGKAQTYTWTGFTSNSWGNDGNWDPSGFTSSGSPTAQFNFDSTTNLSTVLDGNRTVSGIIVLDPSAALSIGAGSGGSLTIGSGGIDMFAATRNLTITANVSAVGTQSWMVNAGQLLTVSGDVNYTSPLFTSDGGGDTTITGLISGSVDIIKTGTGVLTLTNAGNSFTGQVQVDYLSRLDATSIANAGVNSALGAGSEIHFSTGGTLNYVNTTTNASTNRSIFLNSDGAIAVANVARSLTLNGSISGIGRLTIGSGIDNGTVFLTGDNSGRDGGTTITGQSTLVIDNDSRLGAVPGSPTANNLIISNSSVLRTTTSFTINSNRGIGIANAGAFDVTSGTTLTYGGVIANANSTPQLFKNGAGTLILTGSNTFDGRTRVDAGVLEISSEANLGVIGAGFDAARLGIAGGATLRTTADISFNANRGVRLGAPTGSGDSTIEVASGTTLTINTPIGQLGANKVLAKAGAGTLVLNGLSASTYSGGTVINAGTLRLGQTNVLPTTGPVTLSGGTLSTGATTGHSNSAGDLSVTNNSSIDLGTGSHTLTFAGLVYTGGSLFVGGWNGSALTPGLEGTIVFSGLGANPNTSYSTFLSNVQFDGFAVGGQFISSGSNYELVPVPEPTTVLCISALTAGLFTIVRRRVRGRASIQMPLALA